MNELQRTLGGYIQRQAYTASESECATYNAYKRKRSTLDCTKLTFGKVHLLDGKLARVRAATEKDQLNRDAFAFFRRAGQPHGVHSTGIGL